MADRRHEIVALHSNVRHVRAAYYVALLRTCVCIWVLMYCVTQIEQRKRERERQRMNIVDRGRWTCSINLLLCYGIKKRRTHAMAMATPRCMDRWLRLYMLCEYVIRCERFGYCWCILHIDGAHQMRAASVRDRFSGRVFVCIFIVELVGYDNYFRWLLVSICQRERAQEPAIGIKSACRGAKSCLIFFKYLLDPHR